MDKRCVVGVVLLFAAACAGGEAGDSSPAETASSAPEGVTSTTEPESSELDVDVCSLLTVEELEQLGVEVETPAGEDDLPGDSVQQCTFWMAVSVTVVPKMSFDDYYSDANGGDLFDVAALAGPGEWAGMAVDPDTGFVFSVAAGGRRAVVAITPWLEIAPDTPEAELLEELLGLAVSRLDG